MLIESHQGMLMNRLDLCALCPSALSFLWTKGRKSLCLGILIKYFIREYTTDNNCFSGGLCVFLLKNLSRQDAIA